MNRASVVFALLTSVPAVAHARDGFEIGLGLGAATGNFSIDSKEDEADVGAMFELQLGYVWQSGFGVGGGVSSTAFAYTIQVIEEFGGYDNELTLGFTTVELNALYFHPLSEGRPKLAASCANRCFPSTGVAGPPTGGAVPRVQPPPVVHPRFLVGRAHRSARFGVNSGRPSPRTGSSGCVPG